MGPPSDMMAAICQTCASGGPEKTKEMPRQGLSNANRGFREEMSNYRTEALFQIFHGGRKQQLIVNKLLGCNLRNLRQNVTTKLTFNFQHMNLKHQNWHFGKN